MNKAERLNKESGFISARRDVIKSLAVIFAGTLSAKSISAAIAGHDQAPDTVKRVGLIFSAEDFKLVKQMSEMIIPTTDSPGANAADVHGFMDFHIAKCFTQAERTNFLSGLKKINIAAKKKYKKDFLNCDKTIQVEILQHIESKHPDFSQNDRDFFKQFKALTLFGYYTSEIGATQELSYQAIPGGYRGSIPFSTVGKAWAT